MKVINKMKGFFTMKTQFIILQRKTQIDFSGNISNQMINQNDFVIECLLSFPSIYYYLGLDARKPDFGSLPDRRLCYSHFGKYHV